MLPAPLRVVGGYFRSERFARVHRVEVLRPALLRQHEDLAAHDVQVLLKQAAQGTLPHLGPGHEKLEQEVGAVADEPEREVIEEPIATSDHEVVKLQIMLEHIVILVVHVQHRRELVRHVELQLILR